MSRKTGDKNIQSFADRSDIATTDSAQVRHLSRQTGETPVEQYKAQLKHQRNYLRWIDTRHGQLQTARAKLEPNGRGPKDSVYRKYRWYAEQTTLLEAINCFEVFYKNTFIGLASAIRRQVPPERIKGAVDARVLWTSQGKTSFPSLIFEHQLYHDLEHIDKVSNMLVGAKRYSPNNLNAPLRTRVVALQAVFQVRHTLSHNQGRVTQSDSAKFSALGYKAVLGEILDPSKDNLGRVIRELLENEATQFTNWILEKCANFLDERQRLEGMELPAKLKVRIEKEIGSHSTLDRLNWV